MSTFMHTFHCPIRPVPAVTKAISHYFEGGARITWVAESLYVEAGSASAEEVKAAMGKAGLVNATHVLTEDMDEGPGA